MSEQQPVEGEVIEGDVTVGGKPAWFRRTVVLLSISAVLGVLLVAAGAFAFWSIYDDAAIPSPDQLAIPDPTLVRDQDDGPLATLQPAAVRRNRALDDLPDHVPNAVIAAEDRAFHSHSGISPRGIIRAAWANITRGERVQGASTIPQQYVELAITDIPDSYLGKFREAATAVRLDRELSKEQILENYLNAVPWGRQAYGIEAAARTYFDVGAVELDLHQSAVLAGMIAAPTAFDPARHPERAAARRDFVLEGMVEIGAISRAEADELIGTQLPELRSRPLVDFGAEAYFVDGVEREVARILEELDDDRDPTVGLRITTTYDPQAQELALDALNEQLEDTEHTGSVVTIDHATGAVKALIGGRDYDEQEYNVAIERQSLRSPGSAFKTFALTAFVDQGYHPDVTRVDGPNDFSLEVEGQDDYEPENFGGRSYYDITVREATVRSVNTAYVALADEMGPETVTEMANQLGVRSELSPVPSAVLGSQGVTPLDMAEAYATLAAEGVHHDPYLISRIATHEGEVLYEHEVEGEEVVDPNTAAVVTDVLSDVVARGTGTAAQTRQPTAGKTGTTNDSTDAWFVGYTPTRTTAVWVGNLDNSSMGDVTGGSTAAAIFGDYMDDLVGDEEPRSFPTPDLSGLERFQELRPAPPPPPPAPSTPSPSGDGGDDEGEDDADDAGDDEGGDEGDDEGDDPPPAEDDDGTDDGGGNDGGGGDDDAGGGGDDGTDGGGTDDGGSDGGGSDGGGGGTDGGGTDGTDGGGGDGGGGSGTDGGGSDGGTDGQTTSDTTTDGADDGEEG